MARYTPRGNTHCIVYEYWNQADEYKQHWETYTTELEAVTRKAHIDFLQKNKDRETLHKEVLKYKDERVKERASLEAIKHNPAIPASALSAEVDNTDKTYREFAEKWLPFHARKNQMSPNSYDGYVGSLRNHIYPYFGDRIMSTIMAEDIDNFLDYLSRKPCSGSASYRKTPEDTPTLASGTVKKCYTVLTAGFPTAKKWRYIKEIPETTAPVEKNKKRKAWDPTRVLDFLDGIKEDELLHLAVHIAFVCSLRAGETTGISIETIDFHDRSLWITQQVQRVSDNSLLVIPKNEIIRVFPKIIPSAKSSLILKGPKTEGSVRKNYLTTPLLQEIKERLNQIKRNKEFFGSDYQDYGLLLCHPDGRPIESKFFGQQIKRWQEKLGIHEQIEFQGLRKSGQMHKVRLTKNNYQLVAENSGQSPEVLMSNYNDILESEKRTLSLLIETSFYPSMASTAPDSPVDLTQILQAIQNDPEVSRQIMQLLQSKTIGA
jgi:integrase